MRVLEKYSICMVSILLLFTFSPGVACAFFTINAHAAMTASGIVLKPAVYAYGNFGSIASEGLFMDQPTTSANSARRNEDIALDLLKFVASTAGLGRATSASPGFVAASAPKPEDQVTHLLEIYTRCLHAVEGKGEAH